MKDIDNLKKKYENFVFENLDKENFHRIIGFLVEEKCDFIEDIVYDYLDLFNFDYEDFVEKYKKLNKKYNGSFLKRASENMNLLEEFYTI